MRTTLPPSSTIFRASLTEYRSATSLSRATKAFETTDFTIYAVALCRDHNVAVVFGDDDEFPCIDADTADFRYARLQRMSENVTTGYDEARLDEFARTISGWAEAGRDVYAFLINGAKVRAPAAALALQERLG